MYLIIVFTEYVCMKLGHMGAGIFLYNIVYMGISSFLDVTFAVKF